MLGGALLGQMKYDDAEPLLLAGYQGLIERQSQIPSNSKARIVEAVDRLIELYIATGKPEKAAAWRAKRPPEIGPAPREVKP
jgi:hypothetical protein